MLSTSIIILIIHFIIQQKTKNKPKKLNNRLDEDVTVSHNTLTTFPLLNRVAKETLMTSLVLFLLSGMFTIGGAVHDRVPDLDLPSILIKDPHNSTLEELSANLEARKGVILDHILWSAACIFCGFSASTFMLLTLNVLLTNKELKNILECEMYRSRSSTDDSQAKLILPGQWNILTLKTKWFTSPKAFKIFFILFALSISCVNTFFQISSIMSFLEETNENSVIYDKLIETNILRIKLSEFKLLKWSDMWNMEIPSILLQVSLLFYALSLVYIFVTSQRSNSFLINTNFYQTLRRAMCLRCIGAWIILFGGVLQFVLASICLQDLTDEGLQTSLCHFPIDFNHNAIYHLVSGVGVPLVAFSQIWMESIIQRSYISQKTDLFEIL